MNSINPIGSTTSMAAYKVADDSQKTDATKKAAHHGHGGGHHRAEAPAPTPDVDPTTDTSTSSILDVTA